MSSSSDSSEESRVQIINVEDLNESINSIRLSEYFTDNSDIENSQENINMPETAAARVPSTEQLITAARHYGEIIPRFSGKPNALEAFIIKVDQFYNKYGNTNDDSLNNYVFCMISSRLSDEANDFVTCRPDLVDWPSLKDALRNKFGDLTDRKILTHQFKTLKINASENLKDFIERIKAMQTRLNVKIQMDTSITNDQKIIYKEIFEQTALEVLYNNCPSMLQTILDVKDHSTMAEACNTVINYITKHPAEKSANFHKQVMQKPKPNIPTHMYRPFPQYFRTGNPQQQFHPRTTDASRPSTSFVHPAQNAQQPVNGPRNQNVSQSYNNPNKVSNIPAMKQTPVSTTSQRLNRYQSSGFKNWRSPRPQVHCTELVPEYADENPDDDSYYLDPTYYDTTPENSYCNNCLANFNVTDEAYSDENYYSPTDCSSSEQANNTEHQAHTIENFHPTASDKTSI